MPHFDDSDPHDPLPPRRTRRAKRSFLGRVIRFILTLFIVSAMGLGVVLLIYGHDMPDTSHLLDPKRKNSVKLLSDTGETIATSGGYYAGAVMLSDMPQDLINAVVATEDRRFWYHFGFDPLGILRAIKHNITHSGRSQGGSTLTQQLAKNLFLTSEQTLSRKLQELALAITLEFKFTKEEILTIYLNRVYLGAGVYGVEAASQRYFGKSAKELTLNESAVIAGLLKAPSHYAPTSSMERARERANVVLGALKEAGYISQSDYEKAVVESIYIKRAPGGNSAGYFSDWVMDQLPSYVGSLDEDLVIYTTFNSKLQNSANAALGTLMSIEGTAKDVSQAALVSMNTHGAVLAMIGGVSYQDSPFNRATQALRQPGSSFKPFVYMAALEKGYNPWSVVNDEPIQFGKYRPENYTQKFLGAIPLTEAVKKSVNTVAVKLADEVGLSAVKDVARRFGILSPLSNTLSLALGASEVTLLELSGAYVPFANQCLAVQPYGIDKIETSAGEVIYERPLPTQNTVCNLKHYGYMLKMLESVTQKGGTGASAAISGVPMGGKTGTSSSYKDAWFVGFTPNLVTGVWVGNDKGEPMKKVTGGSLPAVLWRTYMVGALSEMPAGQFVRPSGTDTPPPADSFFPALEDMLNGSETPDNGQGTNQPVEGQSGEPLQISPLGQNSSPALDIPVTPQPVTPPAPPSSMPDINLEDLNDDSPQNLIPSIEDLTSQSQPQQQPQPQSQTDGLPDNLDQIIQNAQ